MRIDKRLPFGFLGEWGKVYKLYNTDVKAEEYAELEWIDCDASFWFNLGKSAALSDTAIYLDIWVAKQDLSRAVYYSKLNGLTNHYIYTGDYFIVYYRQRPDATGYEWFNNLRINHINISIPRDGRRYKIELLNHENAINGNVNGEIVDTMEFQHELPQEDINKYLLGSADGGQFIGKFYECKLGNVNGWLNDYVPCKRISDGVIGLYDKSNDKFYLPSSRVASPTIHSGEETGVIYTSKGDGVLQYQKSHYRDIGQDVQFKCAGGKQIGETPAVKNLLTHSESKFIETSDAWFDGHQYKCVVDTGDIVKYENEYWVVESLQQEEIYTPQEHSIWKIAIKKIYGVE